MTINKHLSGQITNPTLKHLLEWIDAINLIDDENEEIFSGIEDLAISLDNWRQEFIRHSKSKTHYGDAVAITVYASTIILVADNLSGEYFKLQQVNKMSNPINQKI